MSSEPGRVSGPPVLWRTLSVLGFLAGAVVIFWGQLTRSVGESATLTAVIGGGLVGLGGWLGMRAKLASKQQREVSPSA